ncbi:hypothetical protein H4S04_006855, partial [Coemansia sp. S16]
MSYSRLSSQDYLPLYNRGDISWNSSESVTVLGTASLIAASQDGTDLAYYKVLSKHHVPSSCNKCASLLLHVPKSVAVAGLLTIFAASYLLSLQAGNLDYIHEHLGIMGIELLVSVTSLTIVTVMLYA